MFRMGGKITDERIKVKVGEVKYRKGVFIAFGVIALMSIFMALTLTALSGGMFLMIVPFFMFFQVTAAIIGSMTMRWRYLKQNHVREIGYTADNSFLGTEYEERIYRVVGEMSAKLGIKCPKVAVEYTNEINAYAIGFSKNKGLVVFTTGLLNSISEDSVCAITAHELGHIVSGDMMGKTIANCLQYMFTMIIGLAIKILLFPVILAARAHGAYLIEAVVYLSLSIVIDWILFGLSQMIILGYSRRREFKADLFAAKLVGKDAVTIALSEINNAYIVVPPSKGVYGYAGVQRMFDIFSTHPAMRRRIAYVQKKAKW